MEEEDSGQLGKPFGVGVPQIRVDEDELELPRRQSVLAQKIGEMKSSDKVKSAWTKNLARFLASVLNYHVRR